MKLEDKVVIYFEWFFVLCQEVWILSLSYKMLWMPLKLGKKSDERKIEAQERPVKEIHL
jgi:hypothetical protein